VIIEILFGPSHDAVHRGDGRDRVVADRRLAAQHDRARAVEHGVRDVGHFGARGTWECVIDSSICVATTTGRA